MPERTALIFGDQKIEYGRLLEAIQRLAGGLVALGVQKGDRVAIMLPNVPHFCISYYAILSLGAIVVPINVMSNEKELSYFLDRSGARMLIAWEGFLAHVLNATRQVPSCQNVLLLGQKIPSSTTSLTRLISQSTPLTNFEEIGEDEPAVINFTIGSGDDELAAVLTHAALLANATTCQEMFRLSPEDRLAGVMPLFHPLGQSLAMNMALLTGAALALVPRFTAAGVLETVRNAGITFMAAVPGMFRALANAEPSSGTTPSLKLCLVYGGSMPQDLLHQFEEKFNTLIMESYGLTEAGPLVSAARLHRDRKIGSVGLPLLGVDVQIRDDRGLPARPNQSGEIWINSPSSMHGYYNDPEATAARLRDGWLFTGDIGYLDDEHYLYIQERKDDIIVKGGFHIFPFEVEAVIKHHVEVAEVAVIAVPDPVQGAEVKAYVVRRAGATCGSEELIEYCRNQLPYYKSPRYVEFVEALPVGPTGRVMKHQLRKQAASQYRGPREPRT
jgi:long-chain acyl-CoA synthetase